MIAVAVTVSAFNAMPSGSTVCMHASFTAAMTASVLLFNLPGRSMSFVGRDTGAVQAVDRDALGEGFAAEAEGPYAREIQPGFLRTARQSQIDLGIWGVRS
ncbi:MAG: hypothetical protein WHS86_07355 [Desulfosoma sp.]